ncbi:uncharacterized protein STEHIDRAFT_118634 [Stereum hirsutum FP-91666 SS1]|uniref:uncharacterized protein n=1 Tax=Stereum hirsutum (strain FP-91666) TaxID=721885 RepID=UPI000440B1B7|nr:uncharacterized protein STEHIDRAFT_118634 [Stereum hirsutum FP-91666 SS1]EIM91611.1 hypothetical protein STEHIDRAFT_118634 [Stereum hirsutum FP-91666 SS1]
MAYPATRGGPSTSAPGDGSRTMLVTDSQPRPEGAGTGDDAGDHGSGDGTTAGRLRLRGAAGTRPRVAWVEDTVDNEGMGKKKTKICCIYHKPKKFDESSDEDSSDSESDSDSDSGRARPSQSHRGHHHHHPHREDGGASGGGTGQRAREGGGGVVHQLENSSSDERNAYEVMPGRPKKGKGRAGE